MRVKLLMHLLPPNAPISTIVQQKAFIQQQQQQQKQIPPPLPSQKRDFFIGSSPPSYREIGTTTIGRDMIMRIQPYGGGPCLSCGGRVV